MADPIRYTRSQLENIRKIKRTPAYKAASARERKALFLATRVESNHEDLNYGDRDSLGILQQRNNGAWGAAKEDVATDATQFLEVARRENTKGGSAGQLAQRVQRSAFPDRYDEHSAEADALIGGDRPAKGRAAKAYGVGKVVGGKAPTLTPGSSSVDTEAAVRAAILDPRKKMSLSKRILENVTSGAFTTETPAKIDPGVAPKYKVSKAAPGEDAAPAGGVDLPKSGKNNWGVVEHAGRSGLALQKKFGIKEIGGYRASDPFPDHPSRKALDLMVYKDRAKGDAIAAELTRNHKKHGVKYLIWNQRIWHPGQGWRKMEDRGSPTQNHEDHVHVLYT